jgi:hypothetical protein
MVVRRVRGRSCDRGAARHIPAVDRSCTDRPAPLLVSGPLWAGGGSSHPESRGGFNPAGVFRSARPPLAPPHFPPNAPVRLAALAEMAFRACSAPAADRPVTRSGRTFMLMCLQSPDRSTSSFPQVFRQFALAFALPEICGCSMVSSSISPHPRCSSVRWPRIPAIQHYRVCTWPPRRGERPRRSCKVHPTKE